MTSLARTAPDTLQLTPGTALDAEGALALRPTLESLALSGAPRVVLDLSRVERMDGSGIVPRAPALEPRLYQEPLEVPSASKGISPHAEPPKAHPTAAAAGRRLTSLRHDNLRYEPESLRADRTSRSILHNDP